MTGLEEEEEEEEYGAEEAVMPARMPTGRRLAAYLVRSSAASSAASRRAISASSPSSSSASLAEAARVRFLAVAWVDPLLLVPLELSSLPDDEGDSFTTRAGSPRDAELPETVGAASADGEFGWSDRSAARRLAFPTK